MKERPIIFSGAMVRAILDGTKTQTRRVMKPQPPDYLEHFRPWYGKSDMWLDQDGSDFSTRCPYGEPGDRLWVKETHQAFWIDDLQPALDFTESQGVGWRVRYPATDGLEDMHIEDRGVGAWCRPSIHMPRWASRITLELTDVRVQRLQAISEEDARAEGAPALAEGVDDAAAFGLRHLVGFARLWDSINLDRAPWADNPWVWALTFRRVKP